ncbi:MAG: type II toxin-antitoxin system VapC family toxin [Gemmatimonadota bacterium]|jgi:ribonuclease VapC
MILDSSAIVAIAFREPGHERLVQRIASSDSVGIGAPTLVESAIVLSARLNRDARAILSRLLTEGGIETIPFGAAHFGVAVGAWLEFGRGRHPAALNFGDCLAYATARVTDRALLCVGDDFERTDLEIA